VSISWSFVESCCISYIFEFAGNRSFLPQIVGGVDEISNLQMPRFQNMLDVAGLLIYFSIFVIYVSTVRS
jgi:hypothetical protein